MTIDKKKAPKGRRALTAGGGGYRARRNASRAAASGYFSVRGWGASDARQRGTARRAPARQNPARRRAAGLPARALAQLGRSVGQWRRVECLPEAGRAAPVRRACMERGDAGRGGLRRALGEPNPLPLDVRGLFRWP